MMSRLAFVVTASLCLGLLLFTPSAEAQQEVHAVQQNPQSQGFLERIMTDYVYPIRDYDWRSMVRRLLNGVMDYLAPDAKEPKVGGPYGHPNGTQSPETNSQDSKDVARAFGYSLADWISQRTRSFIEALRIRGASKNQPLHTEGQNGETARVLSLNSNVPANAAQYSLLFLFILTCYSLFSTFGAILAIYKFPPKTVEDVVLPESMTVPEMSYLPGIVDPKEGYHMSAGSNNIQVVDHTSSYSHIGDGYEASSQFEQNFNY